MDKRTLIAFNTATASENKIHDDVVASRFGFTGGLVPGVDVFAYLAHMPMARWGLDWLGGGSMQARFVKPVYDGQETLTEASEEAGMMNMTLRVEGGLCASASARLGGCDAPEAVIGFAPMPDPAARPAASTASLAPGRILGTLKETYSRKEGLEHIAATRGDAGLYDDGRIANAAWLLRRANYVLADNVQLGPWIHVESAVDFHGILRDGEEVQTRAVVADNFESKGHLIVVLDIQMVIGSQTIMSGRHTAIYEPRQVRQAG